MGIPTPDRLLTLPHTTQVPSPDGSGALDDHGVHAFVVPLRDEQGQLCTGVEIHDCGYKASEGWMCVLLLLVVLQCWSMLGRGVQGFLDAQNWLR